MASAALIDNTWGTGVQSEVNIERRRVCGGRRVPNSYCCAVGLLVVQRLYRTYRSVHPYQYVSKACKVDQKLPRFTMPG